MSQKDVIDIVGSGDYSARHAASIKYFEEHLAYAEAELRKMLLIQNPNAGDLKRIEKLKEIQKNCRHNLEITIAYTQTKRPYGL